MRGITRSRGAEGVARRLAGLGLVLAACASLAAQPAGEDENRWEAEIAEYEVADRGSPPRPGGVVFTGSSSIRLWSTLAQDFPDVAVLNRGFGGSQVRDATRYLPRIVVPYKPRMVVLYSGGNDINAGRTPEQVAADVGAFVRAVHAALPDARIGYISIAGNPARWAHVEQVKRANALIAAAMKSDPRLAFIDVFPHMMGPDGQPKPDIFVEDRLHMNREGYRIWTRTVAPFLRAER